MMGVAFLADCTDYQSLDDALSNGVVPPYIGYVATAASLPRASDEHHGPALAAKCGHKPITLMGGGDVRRPSFRSDERLTGTEQIQANIDGMGRVSPNTHLWRRRDRCDHEQRGMFGPAEPPRFLRDIGRHFN
jgi:tyrosyl-tRNA synthetase